MTNMHEEKTCIKKKDVCKRNMQEEKHVGRKTCRKNKRCMKKKHV